MADKNLKIDVSVETTGDGGTKAAGEIREIETAAGDAQGAAQDLEKSLDSAGETTVAPEVNAGEIEEAGEQAGGLKETLEEVDQTAAVPAVDATQITEAATQTQDLKENLAEVEASSTTINVDSSQILDANESLRETGEAADDASPPLVETAANFGTIISGAKDAGSWLKSLQKIFKSVGLGGTDAAKGIGLAALAMRIFNLVSKANPFLAVAGAVAAITGAFVLFKKPADDAAASTEELKDETVKIVSELDKEAEAAKRAEERLKGLTKESGAAAKAASELAKAKKAGARAQIDLDEATGTIDAPEAARRRAILEAQSDTEELNRLVEEVRQRWSAAAGQAFTEQAAAEMARNAADRAVQAVGDQLANLETNPAFQKFMKNGEFDTAAADEFVKKVNAPDFAGKNLDTREDVNLAKVLEKELQRLEVLKAQAALKVEAALASEREATVAEEIAATEQGNLEQAKALAEEKQKSVDLTQEATLAEIDASEKKASAQEKETTALKETNEVSSDVADTTSQTADNLERGRTAMEGTAAAANTLAAASERASNSKTSQVPGLNVDQPVDLFNPARPRGLNRDLTASGSDGFGTGPSGPVPPSPVPPTGGQPAAGGDTSGTGTADSITAAADRAGEAATKIEQAATDAGQRIEASLTQVESAVTNLTGKLEAKIQALSARINALGG